MCLTETWLSTNIRTEEYFSGYYAAFRRDQDFASRGGGVLITWNKDYDVGNVYLEKLHQEIPTVDIVETRWGPSTTTTYFKHIWFFKYLWASWMRILDCNHLILHGNFNVPSFVEVDFHDLVQLNMRATLTTVC